MTLVLAFVLGCSSRDAAPADAGMADAGPDCDLRCEGAIAICGESREQCPSERCVDGTGCVECAPGERICRGRDVYACGDDGAPAELVEACTGNTACDAARCEDVCARAPSSSGCRFLAVTTLSSRLGASVRYMSSISVGAEGYHFGIALSNPNDYEVSVRIEGPSTDRAEVVPARSATVVAVPWVGALTQEALGGLSTSGAELPYRSTPSSLVPGAAYRVESDAPIVAYQFAPYNLLYDGDDLACPPGSEFWCTPGTVDASLLLPVPTHGRAYTVVGYGSRYAMAADCDPDPLPEDATSGFVTIVAGHEPTEVTITPSTPIRPGPGVVARAHAGDPFTVRLEPYDVLQLVADRPITTEECTAEPFPDCSTVCTYRGDLSGTTIEADEPIAVFAGHDCARVPYDEFGSALVGCDHLEDQLWPDETLGLRYVVMPLYQSRGALSPTLLRLVGTRDATRVTLSPRVDGIDELTLGRGEAAELDLFAPGARIEATEPIAVAIVSPSSGLGLTNGFDSISDPSLVVAVPVEQWVNENSVYAAETFAETYAAIAAPRDAIVRLDGTELAPFDTSGEHDYYHALLAGGPHRITASAPFTAVVSGHSFAASYAYPAGGQLEPLILE
jgi:hypothetical protein